MVKLSWFDSTTTASGGWYSSYSTYRSPDTHVTIAVTPKCFFCNKELDKQYKTIKVEGCSLKYVCNDCEYIHKIIHDLASNGKWDVIRDIYYWVVENSYKTKYPEIKKKTGKIYKTRG